MMIEVTVEFMVMGEMRRVDRIIVNASIIALVSVDIRI